MSSWRASSALPRSAWTTSCSTASTSSCRRGPASIPTTSAGPRPRSPTPPCAGARRPEAGGSDVEPHVPEDRLVALRDLDLEQRDAGGTEELAADEASRADL